MRGLTFFLSFLPMTYKRGQIQSFAFQARLTLWFQRFALVFSQVIDEGDSLRDHSDGSCHDNHNRYHVLVLLPNVSFYFLRCKGIAKEGKNDKVSPDFLLLPLKVDTRQGFEGRLTKHAIVDRQRCPQYLSKGHSFQNGKHEKRPGQKPRAHSLIFQFELTIT